MFHTEALNELLVSLNELLTTLSNLAGEKAADRNWSAITAALTIRLI